MKSVVKAIIRELTALSEFGDYLDLKFKGDSNGAIFRFFCRILTKLTLRPPAFPVQPESAHASFVPVRKFVREKRGIGSNYLSKDCRMECSGGKVPGAGVRDRTDAQMITNPNPDRSEKTQ